MVRNRPIRGRLPSSSVVKSLGNTRRCLAHMLLDNLLDLISVDVQPFAVCRVHRSWRLSFEKESAVQVHFVVAGGGTLTTAKSEDILEAHSMVIVPAGIAHRIAPDGDILHDEGLDAATCSAHPLGVDVELGSGDEALTMVCGRTVVTYTSVLGIFDHLDLPLVESFANVPEVEQLFAVIMREQKGGLPGSRRVARLAMEECLIHLFRRVCGEEECRMPWLSALEDPGLAAVMAAIVDTPEQPHSLETLAQTAGMSRSVFIRRFTEAFGMPPGDCLRKVRLRRAEELLRTTDMPVKAIATSVGFSSRSHFSKIFKALTGRDPASYRDALN